LELTAAQPVELPAVAGGRRQLNARSLGGSAMHLATMTDFDDQDDALGIVNRIHHAVVASPDPVPIGVSR
jgi:hypothetical protein